MFKNVSFLTVAIAASLMLVAPPADAGFRRFVKKHIAAPVKDGLKSAGDTVERVAKESERKVKKVGHETDNVVKDAGQIVVAATEASLKPLERPLNEIDRTVDRVAKEGERATEKIAHETENGVKNVGEGIEVAAEASLKLAEAGINAQASAVRALAKGNLEEASRAVTVDHWRAADDIAAEAAIESSALRMVGQVAATAYGGPAGGSAFAGWYGYHASGGDWDAAAKGAAVTLAASAVASGVDMIPGDPGMTAGGVRRVVASGAGAAGVVAAAGGDADAIRDGFWMAAATSAAGETYRGTTGIEMSGEVASEGPIAKDPSTPIPQYDPNVSHVGLDKPTLGTPGDGFGNKVSYYFAQEQGPAMQAVAKVPGMNRMAYFHDTWMQNTSVTAPGWVQATIPPAMVLSYMATGVPLAQEVQDDTQ